ncbi:ParB N-terminal domain-containing protein [Sphingomonas psychrotolerans]|uniref:ParB N-terminal domain-containing protein n=1 Tax=Sphingomonas psychrotolerans TaxID=1327635 RepID=A0ABU3N5J0_9SPHN|nr:ParB N-terminal domain-containing protein [Sphingomonas psychrotolerans]MDT8758761.1 ParB N-terminal domain-containing protein [Sphingomonas psychrotolerans]
MELRHIEIARLSVSPANMRGGRKAPDLTNILPSVRARGVLVPLIVRARPCPAPDNGDGPECFEIVAGKRRYHAALAVAEEGGEIDALPCAVMDAGDDAAALEASLIENVARLDPDEVTRWETFTRLVREGRKPEHIAILFGLTDVQVKRTLALGNLLPRIRTLYRKGEVDVVTVQHLTLASMARQREWLALLDDPEARAPVGQALKAWLFGGASISTRVALFDLAAYEGEIVADLFGEESWFGSAEQFWIAQDAAIEARIAAYREAGWADVVTLEPGQYFHAWEHERCPRKKGGKVYVAIGQRGEVAFHEGYVSRKEAKKGARGEVADRPIRPEITSAGNDYVDLHRHAAVRVRLASAPGVALRVAVAHMITGSPLWSVKVEDQRAPEAVRESVELSVSEAMFDAKRREMLALLGYDPETLTVSGGEGEGLATLFVRLVRLDDAQVLDILAIVMGETLHARSSLVDLLGQHLGVDMAPVWRADDAFFDLIRDREVLLAIVEEVADRQVATGNAKETGKVLKSVIRDCLSGSRGRTKVEGWVPRWMRFPASGYTPRGGVGAADRSAVVAPLLAPAPVPDPDADAAKASEGEPVSPKAPNPDAHPVAASGGEPVREAA